MIELYVVRLLQLVLACVGAAYSLSTSIESYEDVRWVKASDTNGNRRIVAHLIFEMELTRLVVQVLLIGSGVLTLAGVFLDTESRATMMFLFSAFLMYQTFRVWVARRKIRRQDVVDAERNVP